MHNAERDRQTLQRFGTLFLVMVLASSTVACKKWRRRNSARANAAASHPDGAAPNPLRDPLRNFCRVADVDGAVTKDSPSAEPNDAAIASTPVGTNLSPTEWVRMGPRSHFVVLHPRSHRESIFRGPGRSSPCANSPDEESWLAEGWFESVKGSGGERAGGEYWIVTPYGVVRYSVATLRIQVTARNCRTEISTGLAYLWTADGSRSEVLPLATDAGLPARRTRQEPLAMDSENWARLDPGTVLNWTFEKPVDDEARADHATAKCSTIAATAKRLAEQIASPGANLSELAPEHVMARRTARAACGVAQVRTYALSPSSTRDTLLAKNIEADANWRWVPR